MAKLKPGTLIEIYKDTPAFLSGDIATILDTSGDGSYLVSPLRYGHLTESNLFEHMERYGKWVDQSNFRVINLSKSKAPLIILGVSLILNVILGVVLL